MNIQCLKVFTELRLFLVFLFCIQCKSPKPVDYADFLIENSLNKFELSEIKQQTIDDTTFVNVLDFSFEFILDLKYATEDNFLNQKVYPCESCFLRLKALKNLLKAQANFKQYGYQIKLFDCYRPHSVQQKMWQIMPNATYVADPSKGSVHNRGGAVDLTLVDKNGNELNMGTAFDFFGEASAHAYENLSDEVKKNRKLLKSIMERAGFQSIKSEWWHYQLPVSAEDKIANFVWECPN